MKYIQLGKQDWSIGFSGEVRLRQQGFRIRETSVDSEIRDSYLLQRYLLGLDLRMGKRFRFYGEIQSGIISGKVDSPRQTDKDLLDIHQGFLQYRSPEASDRSLQIRVGRQELNIGSSRLIAAAQGLNVKRSFDGAAVSYDVGIWNAQAGVARLVKLEPGVVDDPPDPGQNFWAASLARRGFPFQNSIVGVYYLGVDRKLSQYVQGQGPEQRHTVGMRFAGTRDRLDFSYDLIFQWGRFQALEVRSWALATDTGYRLGDGRVRPRVGLSANYAAGDRDPADGKLQSFNPLFPGSTYSGLVGLFGPTNLADLTPSLRIPVLANLLLAAESPFYWRTSGSDGIYSIDLRVLLDGQHTKASYVGTNPGIVVSWQPFQHVNVSGVVTRFVPGAFLTRTFVENGFSFYSAAVTYRF